jgi:hypothetical protein
VEKVTSLAASVVATPHRPARLRNPGLRLDSNSALTLDNPWPQLGYVVHRNSVQNKRPLPLHISGSDSIDWIGLDSVGVRAALHGQLGI